MIDVPYHIITFFLFPQIHHHSMDVAAILIAADLHKAKVLKEVCFECIFVRGSTVLQHPSFESMDATLAIELLRDFATRRSVRTQFAEAEEAGATAVSSGKKRKAGQ